MLIFPTTNETYSLVSVQQLIVIRGFLWNSYSWVSVKQLFVGFCETVIRVFLWNSYSVIVKSIIISTLKVTTWWPSCIYVFSSTIPGGMDAINIVWKILMYSVEVKKTLENTDGAIKNGKSRETGNKTKKTKTKTKRNMCWTSLCTNKHK